MKDKIVHLLRRAGFAARPEEIETAVAQGLEPTVNELFAFARLEEVDLVLDGLDVDTNDERGRAPRGFLTP